MVVWIELSWVLREKSPSCVVLVDVEQVVGYNWLVGSMYLAYNFGTSLIYSCTCVLMKHCDLPI